MKYIIIALIIMSCTETEIIEVPCNCDIVGYDIETGEEVTRRFAKHECEEMTYWSSETTVELVECKY